MKPDQETKFWWIAGAGAVLAAFLVADKIGSALGIKSDEQKTQEINTQISNDSKYIVKRFHNTYDKNGKIIKSEPIMVNLATVSRQLFEDMGGHNLLGLGGQFIPTSQPVDTIKVNLAPSDMVTVAKIYADQFQRNLKEDLLFRLTGSAKTDLAKYLNAF
jgi:hypothetical protein